MSTKRCATHVTLPDGSSVYVSGKTKKERDDKAKQKLIEYGARTGAWTAAPLRHMPTAG